MIAVDTNVVVRLLVGDDPDQAGRARNLFEQNAIWIGSTVLLETEWVLRGAYKFSPNAIHRAFEMLLGLPQLTVGDQSAVVAALDWYRSGFDFADALHVAAAAHASSFATFDKALLAAAKKDATTPPIRSL